MHNSKLHKTTAYNLVETTIDYVPKMEYNLIAREQIDARKQLYSDLTERIDSDEKGNRHD